MRRVPSPLVWLHVSKCGSSFINTLIHQPGLCPGLPDSVVVDGTQPLATFWNKYPNLEAYCPGAFESYSRLGYHFGLGEDYDRWKGRLMVFLRNPEQRIISGWYHEQHDWPFATPPRSLWEYANVVRGCAVRMLTRSGMYHQNASNVCGGPEPVTPGEVQEAVRRLWDGFDFVGLTDQWNLSICLFHTMYGGPCRDSDFIDNRLGLHHGRQQEEYNASAELGSFVDDADTHLYSTGTTIFTNHLHRYGVSEETCGWCYTPPFLHNSAREPELTVAGAENLCSEGRLLPELYILGASKSGTTSLAEDLVKSGVGAALFSKRLPSNLSEKEFHFFDCSVQCRLDAKGRVMWSGNKSSWLQQLPSCPMDREALGDFTPHNLRSVPLPPGANSSSTSQGVVHVPETLVSFYGETLKRKLAFVVLLEEPLKRFHSAYYHGKSINFDGEWSGINGSTFEESLRASLNAARSVPPRYSDQGLWAGMYSWHLQGFLRHFAAAQFIVVPSKAYFHGGTALCKMLSRHLTLDLCGRGDWSHTPHSNSHAHPPLEEDISLALRANFSAFMSPEYSRLIDVLADAHRDGAQLFNYNGTVGSGYEIDSWLQHFWRSG